jgi:hypothetical protein
VTIALAFHHFARLAGDTGARQETSRGAGRRSSGFEELFEIVEIGLRLSLVAADDQLLREGAEHRHGNRVFDTLSLSSQAIQAWPISPM